MATRTHISILLGFALVVYALMLMAYDTPVDSSYLRPFFVTVSAVTALCFVFDRWLWHWPVFKKWLVNRPDLRGSWKATLVSDYRNPETGQPIPPIEAVMVIRQTYSTLTARLYTRESSSASVAYNIAQDPDGLFRLFNVYQNVPAVELRGERSEIHFGALALEVHDDPPARLSGHYWTDRSTKGSLELTDRTAHYFPSFTMAAVHFGLPTA